MKNAICSLLILVSLVSTTGAASPLKSLLGSWTGQRKDEVSSSVIQRDVRLKGVRLLDGTIRLTEETAPFRRYNMVTRHDFRPNGVYKKVDVFLNSTSLEIKGRWRFEGDNITISGTSYGVSKGTGSIKFSHGTLIYVWNDLIEHRITIKARR
jgi:hypothetical protein